MKLGIGIIFFQNPERWDSFQFFMQNFTLFRGWVLFLSKTTTFVLVFLEYVGKQRTGKIRALSKVDGRENGKRKSWGEPGSYLKGHTFGTLSIDGPTGVGTTMGWFFPDIRYDGNFVYNHHFIYC